MFQSQLFQSLSPQRRSLIDLIVRMALGLVQALLLIWARRNITHLDVAEVQTTTVTLVALFVPIILSTGMGVMRWRLLLLWALLATGIIVGVTMHAADPQPGVKNFAHLYGTRDLTFILCVPLALWMFIAHCLLLAAEAQRKLLAGYRHYFDAAWKGGLQMFLAGLFVGAFWLLLLLGAGLFSMIGIPAIRSLLGEIWFSFPATMIMFAIAIHITDVRPSLTNGMRNLILLLLSWLSPVMTLLVCGFLAALLFTGLDILWGTGYAAAILLGTAATLVILINAAYRDGQDPAATHIVLRLASRINALALTPLVVIAIIATYLRVDQYGLSKGRVLLIACLLISACYAAGYGVAALARAPWMRRLEITNVATAVLILGVVLALWSPLADPARLAVADQMRRLEKGTVSIDMFDFKFLRFESGRYGRAALEQLKARTDGPDAPAVAAKASEALLWQDRYAAEKAAQNDRALRIDMVPPSATLPAGFLDEIAQNHSPGQSLVGNCRNLETEPVPCIAVLVDLDADGVDEVVMQSNYRLTAFRREAGGDWTILGTFTGDKHGDIRPALRKGDIRTVPPLMLDLMVGGTRLRLTGNPY